MGSFNDKTEIEFLKYIISELNYINDNHKFGNNILLEVIVKRSKDRIKNLYNNIKENINV